MRPDHVHEPVLGAEPIGRPVRQQHRGAPNAKETVGYQHGLSVPGVPILRDVLRADNDRVGAPVGPEEIFRQVNGDDPSAATHSSEVKAQDVPPELVAVDDH